MSKRETGTSGKAGRKTRAAAATQEPLPQAAPVVTYNEVIQELSAMTESAIDNQNQNPQENDTMSENIVPVNKHFSAAEVNGRVNIIGQKVGQKATNLFIMALVATDALAARRNADGTYSLPDGFTVQTGYERQGVSVVSYGSSCYSEDKARAIAATLCPELFPTVGEEEKTKARVNALSEEDKAAQRYCSHLIHKAKLSEAAARAKSGWNGEILAPVVRKAKDKTVAVEQVAETTSDGGEAAGVASGPADSDPTEAEIEQGDGSDVL
jgi:hypothetical protein